MFKSARDTITGKAYFLELNECQKKNEENHVLWRTTQIVAL